MLGAMRAWLEPKSTLMSSHYQVIIVMITPPSSDKVICCVSYDERFR